MALVSTQDIHIVPIRKIAINQDTLKFNRENKKVIPSKT